VTDYRDVLDAAQQLTSSERVQLIDALWQSVDPEDWSPPSEEWIAEVRSRSALYDAGNIVAYPVAEVRERARRKAGLDD